MVAGEHSLSGKERLAIALGAHQRPATSMDKQLPGHGTRPKQGTSSNELRQAAARSSKQGQGAGRDRQYGAASGVVRGAAPPLFMEGDCQALLGAQPDNTVDLVFTDPGIGSKEWENGVPGALLWEALFRVAKPGAHLAVFSSRKYSHRVVTAAEIAGWIPRDTLLWVFPKGMPMAIDVGQAVDKKMGGEGKPYFRTVGSMTDEQRKALVKDNPWYGWGTEIRPTWEPISILRKPPEGSVADNVLAWGTGAMNIDATRIEGEERDAIATWIPEGQGDAHGLALTKYQQVVGKTTLGRWPADALFSHGRNCTDAGCVEPCAVVNLEAEFEGTAKYFYCPKASRQEKEKGLPAGGNPHKSVKPVSVCKWVIDLLLPPGGVLLDPYMGTGSIGLGLVRLDGKPVGRAPQNSTGRLGGQGPTGRAPYSYGSFVGMDHDARWVALAEARWNAWMSPA